jgi:type I restriction enzyme S subunit
MKSGEAIQPENILESGKYPVYGGNGLRGYTSEYTHDGIFPLVGRQGALCGNVNYGDGKFWASEHAIVVSPARAVNPRWLGEALRAMNLNQYSVSAAQPGLAVEAIEELEIPVPAPEEQVKIARFLNLEGARIDALISKKTRFIELLKEKRQALIERAVIKGLDAKVKMKDSGVEWLEDIPAHWDVAQVKRLLDSMEYGLSETSEDGGTIEFLTMGNIQDGNVVRTGEKYLRAVPPEYLLRKSDLLFNRTNSLDLVGKVGLLREDPQTPVTFASYLVRFRCKSQVNPEYLNYYLGCNALLEIARALAIPSVSQANLNPNRYGYLQAPLPPKAEQDAIAAYLSAHDARIRTLQARTQKSIDLLRERRAALITAAVTGQIDLRGAA